MSNVAIFCAYIGNNVFVGYGSIILPNVRIGNNVIVGAGTIVSKDIPDNVVVVQGKESTYRILCSYDEYVEKNSKCKIIRRIVLPQKISYNNQ